MQNPFVFWIDACEIRKYRLQDFLAEYFPGVPFEKALDMYQFGHDCPQYETYFEDLIRAHWGECNIVDSDLQSIMKLSWFDVPLSVKFTFDPSENKLKLN